MENLKTIRITGLKRTGLHMGYYTFRGVKKNCYVHLFGNNNSGTIGLDCETPTNVQEFKGLAELKRLMATYPDRETLPEVIDVRDMHTAIHSLWIVKSDSQTVTQLFWSLSTFNDNPLDELDSMWTWNEIDKLTESIGEIDFRNLQGDKFWRNGVLISDVIYKDGENQYKVIGSYDIY